MGTSWWANTFGINKAKPAPISAPMPPTAHNLPDRWALGFTDMLDVFSDAHPGGSLSYVDYARVGAVAPLAAIRNVRINQFSEYLEPRTDEHQSGFRIRLRDRRKLMTPATERRAYEIEQMIQQGGNDRYGYGGFEPNMRALLNDSFRYDQAVAQPLRTRGGKLTGGLIPMDASTFRMALPNADDMKSGRHYPEKNAYLQIGDERQWLKQMRQATEPGSTRRGQGAGTRYGMTVATTNAQRIHSICLDVGRSVRWHFPSWPAQNRVSVVDGR